MLSKIFSTGLDLFALVTPVSIAATNIVFFPLAALWLFGGRHTLKPWPAVWGLPEKLFLVFLGISLVSALTGLDPRHSLREIKNKDFYLLIAIVLVALVRQEEKNDRLLRLFMIAGATMAAWGLVQVMVGVYQNDKSNGVIYQIPKAIEHWPRPILNKLSLLNGRAMGTRGHPLAYAECLMFNWAFAASFLQAARGRKIIVWLGMLVLIGTGILLSQSRGPWLASALMLFLAFAGFSKRKLSILAGISVFFLFILLAVPSLRDRALSTMDRSHHSNKERLHMWSAGYAIWKANPLLGIGPGNVPAVSAAYMTPDEVKWGRWGHLHSTYINFIVERGLLGLIAFFVYFGALALEIWRAMRRHSADPYKSALFLGTLLGMLGFLLSGITETAYNTAVVNMTLYFVVGLALALARHDSRPTSDVRRRT